MGAGTHTSWLQNHLLPTFLLAKVNASTWHYSGECEKATVAGTVGAAENPTSLTKVLLPTGKGVWP